MAPIRGAVKHKNFSIEKLNEIKFKLKFMYKEGEWFYFQVKKPFAGYDKGQVLKVKDKSGGKKITLVQV